MRSRSVEAGLERVLEALHRIEDGVLALLLGSMVLLAPAQIALRNFFDASIAWGDPLLRLLVLWVGLLGALAASRGDRHIRIDALSRVLPIRARRAARALTSLFTACVAAGVAYHAGRFVAAELEAQSIAFAGLPAWLCAAVLPFAFGAIALRYLLGFLKQARGLSAGEAPPE